MEPNPASSSSTADGDDVPPVQLAVEAAGVGTFDCDLVSGHLRWDDRLIALFGYDAAAFDQTFAAFTTRIHPTDLSRVKESLQAAGNGVGNYRAEYRILLPGGETRWIAARGRVLPGRTGRRPGSWGWPSTRPGSGTARRR